MLEKNYTPKDFEEKIYADWENSGDFQPDMRSSSEAFSIVIPPPNVTGVLHLGHALDDTLQDILVRYNRMQGKKVLILRINAVAGKAATQTVGAVVHGHHAGGDGFSADFPALPGNKGRYGAAGGDANLSFQILHAYQLPNKNWEPPMGRKTPSMGTPLFLKVIITYGLFQRKGKIAKK